MSGPDADDDGWPDGTAFCNGPEHFDGFQSDGGHDITHSPQHDPQSVWQTSDILMSSNTAGISNVTIRTTCSRAGDIRCTATPGPMCRTRR